MFAARCLLAGVLFWVSAIRSKGHSFGQPAVTAVSAQCASIDFTVTGLKRLDHMYVFAKRPKEILFLQWGTPLSVRKLSKGKTESPTYRVLMRELPSGKYFQVLVSDTAAGVGVDSPPSKVAITRSEAIKPAPAVDLQVHRTDPRINPKLHDGSVCVDLHWSHPHPELNGHPEDAYFRVRFRYEGELLQEFCEDTVGSKHRNCGQQIQASIKGPPSSYVTICKLRPSRKVTFLIEAFNCDHQSTSASVEMLSPTSAPTVVTRLVTSPPDQTSIAGFRPVAVIDWIPQHNELIEGHAIYLGLRQVSAMKLMCFVPNDQVGHLEVPVIHKNHTFAEDALLLRYYLEKISVHQEQEIFVSTRLKGHLESPVYSFSLGDWLVVEDALKCLTSFESKRPAYVSRPIQLSLTQEEALSIYD